MTADQRRWAWSGGSIAVLVLVFGNQGFRSMISQYGQKRKLEQSLTHLREDHERLQKEWSLIQQDKGYSEYLVRKYLRYGKKGEIEYRFLAPDRRKD